jgi:hypothetical protein
MSRFPVQQMLDLSGCGYLAVNEANNSEEELHGGAGFLPEPGYAAEI